MLTIAGKIRRTCMGSSFSGRPVVFCGSFLHTVGELHPGQCSGTQGFGFDAPAHPGPDQGPFTPEGAESLPCRLAAASLHRTPCRGLCVRDGSTSGSGLARPPRPGCEGLPVSHAGMSRLIELCRSPSKRNSSDAVLVACLVSSQSSPSFLPGLWGCRPGTRGTGCAMPGLGKPDNSFWISIFLFKRVILVSLNS